MLIALAIQTCIEMRSVHSLLNTSHKFCPIYLSCFVENQSRSFHANVSFSRKRNNVCSDLFSLRFLVWRFFWSIYQLFIHACVTRSHSLVPRRQIYISHMLTFFQNYEKQFQMAESGVEDLEEKGTKATEDTRVSSSEADEIKSDIKALQVRWSSLRTRTEVQRNRLESQNSEQFNIYFIFTVS